MQHPMLTTRAAMCSMALSLIFTACQGNEEDLSKVRLDVEVRAPACEKNSPPDFCENGLTLRVRHVDEEAPAANPTANSAFVDLVFEQGEATGFTHLGKPGDYILGFEGLPIGFVVTGTTEGFRIDEVMHMTRGVNTLSIVIGDGSISTDSGTGGSSGLGPDENTGSGGEEVTRSVPDNTDSDGGAGGAPPDSNPTEDASGGTGGETVLPPETGGSAGAPTQEPSGGTGGETVLPPETGGSAGAAPDEPNPPAQTTFRVALNKREASYRILNTDGEEIWQQLAADCGWLEANGYVTCELDLEHGDYTVVPGDLAGYVTPQTVSVHLNQFASTAYLTYQPAQGD